MTPIRVALIEDHDLTRLGLRTTLQLSGAVEIVGEASDGITGLKLLEASQLDVALVDIDLPSMSGIQLTQRFKRLQRDAEVVKPRCKIMMLTLQDSEEAVLAAFAAGADSYCTKDLDAQSLLQAVQSTHEGNNWIDPAIARVILKHNQQAYQDKAAAVALEGKTVVISAPDDASRQLIEAYPLTQRELEVLGLIVAGNSNAAIAEKLYITVGTVKTHVRNILNKLSADDRTQAAVRALRLGLVS